MELMATKPTLPLRILIVDDNRISQRILEKYLGKHNPQHILSSASSGPEAVAALKKAEYDLVFMDICMPDMVSETPLVLALLESDDYSITHHPPLAERP